MTKMHAVPRSIRAVRWSKKTGQFSDLCRDTCSDSGKGIRKKGPRPSLHKRLLARRFRKRLAIRLPEMLRPGSRNGTLPCLLPCRSLHSFYRKAKCIPCRNPFDSLELRSPEKPELLRFSTHIPKNLTLRSQRFSHEKGGLRRGRPNMIAMLDAVIAAIRVCSQAGIPRRRAANVLQGILPCARSRRKGHSGCP